MAAFVETYWVGAEVEPDRTIGVVVDGPIITALPTATIEFVTTVGQRLGLWSAEHGGRLGRRLRGQHLPEADADSPG